ncbi:acyltransferase, partial [Escherichia coli]|uniref:SGNH hydrolase domain-containing protein n=1 Tax=Escherichia coli TaxID=562 RepID=UPI002741211B
EQSFKDYSASCLANRTAGGSLLWGDSHAAALSFGLRQQIHDLIQYNASSCPPLKDVTIALSPHCKATNDFVLSEIERL